MLNSNQSKGNKMETALADLTLKQAKLKLNSLVREAENLDYLSNAELDFMLALVRHIQKLGGTV